MGDVLDAVSARIKAPYFGYAVLAFFAWNWRGLFLLVMTEGTPEQRLAAFDMYTSVWSLYAAPLLTGVFVAATAEWIRLGFEWAARNPRHKIAMSELREEDQKIKEKLKLQAQRQEIDANEEEKIIERAKREDKAVQEIESEEVKQRLQAELEKRRLEKDRALEIAESLSDPEAEMLREAAKDQKGTILKVGYIGGEEIQIANLSFGASSPRDFSRYEAALKSLQRKGLVEQKGAKGNYFQLTDLGWQASEKLV